MESYLRLLEQLVNQDSKSLCPEGVNAVVDLIEREFRAIGWICRREALPGAGDLLICANCDSARYDAMLIGHTDTVHPMGTAAEWPFSVENGLAHGPGAADMKCGVALMVEIARCLPTSGPRVVMAFNPDEEIGSPFSRARTQELARRSRCVFVMEGARQGYVHAVARKGVLQMQVRVYGKSAHAAYVFEQESAPAIMHACRLAVALQALEDRKAETSVNIGTFSGGTARNVVPNYAEFSLDLRMWTAQEARRLRSEVGAICRDGGSCRVELEETTWLPPMEPSEGSEELARLAEHIAQREQILFRLERRAGGSDGNHLCACTDACLDGMGPCMAGLHTRQETLYLDSVEPSLRLMLALLCELPNHRKGKGDV